MARKDRIMIVEDERLIRWSLREELIRHGFEVLEAETIEAAKTTSLRRGIDLMLLDLVLPDGTGLELLRWVREEQDRIPVIMLTAVDRAETAVQAMRLGAVDYLVKPINPDELAIIVHRVLDEAKFRRQIDLMRWDRQRAKPMPELLGSSQAVESIRHFVDHVAGTTANVLLTGETGTGKEIVARALHHRSDRREFPFVALNCSALPAGLIESELFGHEKGAFTDAGAQRRGVFEVADRGTVFLDEIADMPPTMQAKLLRVLDTRTFTRVGGEQELSVDVRVICATNQNLEERVRAQMFREDLFYRINVAHLHIQPLRNRGEDILLLGQHFLDEYSKAQHKNFSGVSARAKKCLLEYRWPGNVRELRNVMERAVVLNEGGEIRLEHLFLSEAPEGQEHGAGEVSVNALSTVERTLIEKALKEAAHNQTKAAKLLGISRDTLRYRMKKFGLERVE